MSIIRALWQCTFSPRLFKVYEVGPMDKPYEPRNLERWGDQVVVSFTTMWSISLYVIPFVVTFMYRRNYPLADNLHSMTKLVAGASAIFIASLVARGYSRATNPIYLEFIKTLNKAKTRYDAETKQQLHKYDFEFWAWPVDFRTSETKGNSSRERATGKVTSPSDNDETGRVRARRQGHGELLLTLPCRLLSYITAHTFAIKLMYPGSISLINYAMRSTLLQGRVDLIKRGGERFKLVTNDNNEIDAMFVDQRNKTTNGDVLVITCEGNCGFYEIGVISTPLSKGYSVLGWNHPGFGGSTGTPYPSQEQNGIDCVMQFAIDRLGYSESQIILYGWSIGGYTATWAAMNYPSVQSLVLDATFDDVLPLAIARMPTLVEGLVRTIVREYLNLNIAEQLNRYNGPILLVRRTEDEMVCAPTDNFINQNIDEDNSLSGNRGNQLLVKLLVRRYPHVLSSVSEFALLMKFLSATPHGRKLILEEVGVNEERCLELVSIDREKHGGIINYPSSLGEDSDSVLRQQLTLFLATKYMKDQQSQHCTPLLRELFHPGWDPTSLTSVKHA